jgi:hypothetical protein
MSETLSLVLPSLGAVAVLWVPLGLCSSTWTPLNSLTSSAPLPQFWMVRRTYLMSRGTMPVSVP